MKALLLVLAGIICAYSHAQDRCASAAYLTRTISPASESHIEDFIKNAPVQSRTTAGLIRIPVVIHNLYHHPDEKITEAQVQQQLVVVNNCLRRRNADTANTPAVFKNLAADLEIEFVLARSNPRGGSTNGYYRKYTPVVSWTNDDKVKFSAETGADAWDARYYLNIWVCNLDRFAGYASFPGGPAAQDGIVIDYAAFGPATHGGNAQGKTLVHEVGHWLALRHLWGDALCGDDYVQDTPKQASYTPGCPTGTRITCGNGPVGDMYMNYMDFTSDACMNLFTIGQKTRARALFEPGGPRALLLQSKGLDAPLFFETEMPEEDPAWLRPNIYPNPASGQVTLDLTYDARWIGSVFTFYNLTGQPVLTQKITSKVQQISIANLRAGIYILRGEKAGEKISFKVVVQ
jgi:hypothetical protein